MYKLIKQIAGLLLIGGKFSIQLSAQKLYLIRGSISAFTIQGAAIVLGFLSGLALARWLGAEAYGIYTYVVSWLTVLGTVAALGTEMFMVKQTAVLEKQNKGLFKGAFLFNIAVVASSSVIVAALSGVYVYVVNPLLGKFSVKLLAQPVVQYLMLVTLIGLPFVALARTYEGTLRGGKHIISSQLPEMLLKPLFFLLLTGIFWWAGGRSISLQTVVYLQLGITILTLFGYLTVHRRKYNALLRGELPVYEQRLWFRGMMAFYAISLLSIINTRADILLLGSLATSADVGIYNIAARLADVPKTILIAANIAMAPVMAELYAAKNQIALQKLLTRSVRLITLAGLPIVVFYLLGGRWLLSFWGAEFESGYYALVIMGFGQLYNLASGSVGIVLMMSGYAQWVSYGLGVGTVVNVALNFLLIPQYGLMGAAIASAITIVVWNLLLTWAVVIKLRLDPTVLGILSNTKQ